MAGFGGHGRGPRLIGFLCQWDPHKACGFLDCEGNRLFVHKSEFAQQFRDGEEPPLGTRLSFVVGADPRSGKDRACDIWIEQPMPYGGPPSLYGGPPGKGGPPGSAQRAPQGRPPGGAAMGAGGRGRGPRLHGVLREWDRRKACGFLDCDGKRLFVHKTEFLHPFPDGAEPQPGTELTFVHGVDSKSGKERACEIQVESVIGPYGRGFGGPGFGGGPGPGYGGPGRGFGGGMPPHGCMPFGGPMPGAGYGPYGGYPGYGARPPQQQRLFGKLCDWNPDKACGFVECTDPPGKRLFVHKTEFAVPFPDGYEPPMGTPFSFFLGSDPKSGKQRAVGGRRSRMRSTAPPAEALVLSGRAGGWPARSRSGAPRRAAASSTPATLRARSSSRTRRSSRCRSWTARSLLWVWKFTLSSATIPEVGKSGPRTAGHALLARDCTCGGKPDKGLHSAWNGSPSLEALLARPGAGTPAEGPGWQRRSGGWFFGGAAVGGAAGAGGGGGTASAQNSDPLPELWTTRGVPATGRAAPGGAAAAAGAERRGPGGPRAEGAAGGGLEVWRCLCAVARKLADPGAALTLEESRSCLVSCVEHGRAQARRAAGKRVVVVVGNTGAGKSAFVNFLHGCAFELDSAERVVVRADSAAKELMKIGHSNKSETFEPQVELAAESFGPDYAFADCPGFLDNRGFEINVANAVNVKRTLVSAASAVVVVIINYHSLLSDRGKGVRDLFHILSGLFGSAENVRKHSRSVLLAISKAPKANPETGSAMSLERLRDRLMDPTGLDAVARELLGAIGGANVLAYHLLGRGDASWPGREEIIARVQSLEALSTPATLFQSAICQEDRESLRCLVASLARGVEATIGAAECQAAADAVADLLELKVVEHGFVAGIVDEAVRSAVDARMLALRAVLAGRQGTGADAGGAAEAEPPADAQQFEEARQELREAGALLAALADVAEARGPLEGMLVEAACQLESAVRAAAELAGREQVEASLREALRALQGNAVREVLELPRAAEAMRAQLERDLAGLRRGAPAEQAGTPYDAEAAAERHAARLAEEEYRARAAGGAWEAHVALAGEKLRARDRALLAEEGGGFWAKTGWSSERLCSECGAAPVNWACKGLTDTDCDVMSAIFRSLS
ncbi:unnamed protein product, partial [Prorocentrum cordatum]